jgi:hypothetical protein
MNGKRGIKNEKYKSTCHLIHLGIIKKKKTVSQKPYTFFLLPLPSSRLNPLLVQLGAIKVLSLHDSQPSLVM